MNFQQLEYFIKLAEVRHFGKAAEKLCISQPALSNAIKRLEAELGCKLFQRSAHQVTLTLEGSIFRERVVRVLNDADGAVAAVRGVRDLRRDDVVRIGSLSGLTRSFLPNLLSNYLEEHVDCAPFAVTEMRDIHECYKALGKGELDFAICGQLADEGMGWTPVAAMNLVAAVHPTHPLAGMPSVSLGDLNAFPVISYREESMVFNSVEAISESSGFSFRRAFFDESSIVGHLSVERDAVALLLDTYAGEEDGISYIPIDELLQPFHLVGAAYRIDALRSREIFRFANYLEERFSELQNVVPMNGFLAPKNLS